MAKTSSVFFCTDCGNESPRWEGQCPACGAWNTLVEEPGTPRGKSAARSSAPAVRAKSAVPVRLSEIDGAAAQRYSTGVAELDFVLGGGIVGGSLILLGGAPGIGKSTLLLQVVGKLEEQGIGTLYVSGEESAAQVRLRADRLELASDRISFLAETDLDAILATVTELKPTVLVIDSIQTVFTSALDSAAGNVGQVRECAARLQRYAKENGVAVFLVGHVTKDGVVAGPRTLEHIVDTVLYFEDTATLDHRMVRAVKNRFGAVDEIGVFRMEGRGLVGVDNPSQLFLGERSRASGSAVTALIEGSRPMLIEIQALCTKASYGAPQRVANGFDRQRLTLLLAVLERRAGLPFSQLDVFLNVVGGIRVNEPGADAAVAAALVSALRDVTVPAQDVFIAELGLGGELRSVHQLERRLAEAARLHFKRAFVSGRKAPRSLDQLEIVPLADISELVQAVGA